MATNFDGHIQNQNYMHAGNPFGGEYYIRHLNHFQDKYPLDFITIKNEDHGPLSELTNEGGGLLLDFDALVALQDIVSKNYSSKEIGVWRYVTERMKQNSTGKGVTSEFSRNMHDAVDMAPSLKTKFEEMALRDLSKNGKIGNMLSIVEPAFKQRLTKSAAIELGFKGEKFEIDTHAAYNNKKLEQIYLRVVEEIENILSFLVNTEYEDGKSFMDVTTFVVYSEFGRTMRQPQSENKIIDVETTGTDHNPLTNTILIGGKNIVGDMLIAESDYRSSSEMLSKAHLALDPDKPKVMGKPFDFNEYRSMDVLPEVYDPSMYLLYPSLINTV